MAFGVNQLRDEINDFALKCSNLVCSIEYYLVLHFDLVLVLERSYHYLEQLLRGKVQFQYPRSKDHPFEHFECRIGEHQG